MTASTDMRAASRSCQGYEGGYISHTVPAVDSLGAGAQQEEWVECGHTRCVMMQDAVPVVRPLQNHLPVVTHRTTVAGFAMPQYLHVTCMMI